MKTKSKTTHRLARKAEKTKKLDIVPVLPIAWCLLYRDDKDDNPIAIRDHWQLFEILTELRYDYRSRIELMFSEEDQGFILSVTLNPVSIRDAYEAGIKKGKEIAYRCANRLGFYEEDEEGVVCYSY